VSADRPGVLSCEQLRDRPARPDRLARRTVRTRCAHRDLQRLSYPPAVQHRRTTASWQVLLVHRHCPRHRGGSPPDAQAPGRCRLADCVRVSPRSCPVNEPGAGVRSVPRGYVKCVPKVADFPMFAQVRVVPATVCKPPPVPSEVRNSQLRHPFVQVRRRPHPDTYSIARVLQPQGASRSCPVDLLRGNSRPLVGSRGGLQLPLAELAFHVLRVGGPQIEGVAGPMPSSEASSSRQSADSVARRRNTNVVSAPRQGPRASALAGSASRSCWMRWSRTGSPAHGPSRQPRYIGRDLSWPDWLSLPDLDP
jgi:hypothetical protein